MQRKRQSTISKLFEKIPAAAKIGTSIFLQSLNFEKFIFQALHFWGGGRAVNCRGNRLAGF